MTGPAGRLARWDRALGRGLRAAADRRPGARAVLALAARAMSPAFRVAVAALCARRSTRRTGLAALGAGVVAALAARGLRDRIGRRRPGPRDEGGFPSRHAAAAVAITAAVVSGDRRLGAVMAGAACIGLAGRVTDGHHDPADIAAGAMLGAVVGRIASAALDVRGNAARA